MATNFDTRLVIWGMERSLSLEDIKSLLLGNYNVKIDYLQDATDLSGHDKTCYNEWRPPNGEQFEIESIDFSGSETQFISAIGKYEECLPKHKAVINGGILPREYRVFNKTVAAVFFELSGRVYCVLEISKSQESKVRSLLFGQSYKYKRKEWGKVQYKDLPQYQLRSEFFYWIFGKRGQQIKIETDGEREFILNLLDVSAVSQSSERMVHDNKSEGANVLGSIPALSGLGVNQNVYEGGFYFTVGNMQLFNLFSQDCTCSIDSDRSLFTEDGSQAVSRFPELAITIYTVLLPELLSLYHKEKQAGEWSSAKEEEQRKNWAIQVIKILAKDNHITLEDIEEIFVTI